MHESLYQTAKAGVSPSDSGCMSLSIRQRMHESLYQTADAGNSPCRRFYQTADAGDSIRQPTQKNHHQTADAGVSLSDSG